MRCTVRYLTRRRNGGVSRSERRIELEGHRIRLGRGTDNEVYLKDLRVNLHQATILVDPDEILIEAVGTGSLRVNGSPVGRAVISMVSQVEVGPYQISILPNDGDADLVIEVELIVPEPTETVEKLIQKGGVRLATTSLGKRPVAWMLFVGLVLIGLVLPIVAFTTPRPSPMSPEAPPLLATLDSIWISGELSSSHSFLNDSCTACHEKPFVPVRSESCMSCHKQVPHHFDTANFKFPGVEPANCTGCHSEHFGPEGIIPAQEALCGGCHRDLSKQPGHTQLIDASDFGTDHPEFKPTVVLGTEPLRTDRFVPGPDSPRERSALKFPHDLHLGTICGPDGTGAGTGAPTQATLQCGALQASLKGINKAQLGCTDCHLPEPGGANMRPVNMHDHCSGCHVLEFTKDDRSRVLPHGKANEVIDVVTDNFLARVLRDADAQEPATGGMRRRAGAQQATVQRDVALNNAMAESKKHVVDVFEKRLCYKCHELTRTDDPNDPAAKIGYDIETIELADMWMPKAKFSHAAHQNTLWIDGRTMQCTDCHAASTSHSSVDILMPKRDVCRACHLGEAAAATVPSPCLTCHIYHRPECPAIQPTTEMGGSCRGTLPPAQTASHTAGN